MRPRHVHERGGLAPPHPRRLQAQLAMEDERRRQWADENVRGGGAVATALPASPLLSFHPTPVPVLCAYPPPLTLSLLPQPTLPQVRRRTDYIPLAFQLLSALAEKGQLQPLVDRAQQAHAAKLEALRQQRQVGQ